MAVLGLLESCPCMLAMQRMYAGCIYCLHYGISQGGDPMSLSVLVCGNSRYSHHYQ